VGQDGHHMDIYPGLHERNPSDKLRLHPGRMEIRRKHYGMEKK